MSDQLPPGKLSPETTVRKQTAISTPRTRRHRARIAAGEIFAQGPIPAYLVERLFASGLLTDEASHDPRAAFDALVRLLPSKINGTAFPRQQRSERSLLEKQVRAIDV